MTEEKIKKPDEVIDENIMKELIDLGVLYSHKQSKAHPNMRPFIGANRHEIDILDARAVLDSLEKAESFFEKTLSEKKDGLILFVGTSAPAKDTVRETAEELGQPYVVNRWLGGTLTNFNVIKERVNYYQGMSKKEKEGKFEKYTKKERLDFSNEIEKLSYNFNGLVKLNRLPDAVFLVNIKSEETALREAKKTGIPVVAIVDSNDNPKEIDYPIIANDHNKSSIEWILNNLKEKIIKK
jgi:small subunit ribosomal protein S2